MKLKSESNKLANSMLRKKETLNAEKRNKGQDTINSIIKHSMTQKIEVNLSDEEEQAEYVPTMKEKFLKNQIKIPKWTLRYNENFRMRWDMFVMLLAIWNCISIPFYVSFEPDPDRAYEISENFIDVCFGLDILIAFRTTYINSKTGFEVV